MTQAFGDRHTVQKLETVQSYLKAYVTALKKQSFELLYVDACAGSGSSIPKRAAGQTDDAQEGLKGIERRVADADGLIVGSAIRALSVDPPFHQYLLNDVKKANVQALREAVDRDFPHLADRVRISRFDANDMLVDLCRSRNWRRTRAVVFIDPFGLQIDYSTLEMLGRTQAVDLWYLVPVFAMYRQVSGEGQIHPDGGPRVDAALGTSSWRDVAVAQEESRDLFGVLEPRSKRAVDVAWFEKVAKERIGAAFGGRVLDEALPLGRDGLQEFSLMFAWANPDPKAELAAKLAKAVLK
jgi:three-Cys-motif partner protein